MHGIRNIVLSSLLALAMGVPGAALAVTAQLVPSRTSGVGPLAVFFDAVQSSASGADPIHELHYSWDFGDPAAGTWAQSGADKNTATGPWASHVYDSVGTYTVTLTVTAPNGSQAQKTQTINVSDPDALYVGSSTACISASGSFSGCPAGAQQVTSSSFNTGMSYRGTNKRVLFRRGDTFSGSGTVGINMAGPGTVGAFGVGSAPIVQTTQAGPAIRFSGRTPQAVDWRIMDLDFRGNGNQYSGAIGGDGTTRQVLLYRLSADNYHMPVSFPDSVINYYGQPLMNDDIAMVEGSLTNMSGGGGGNGFYAASNRMSLMGNMVVDATGVEHVVRIPYVGRGVLSHNYFSTPQLTKHVLKLHAIDATRSYSFPERDSHHFIVSHNTFQGASNPWSVTIGPQNSTSDERVRDGIIEKNYFLAGPGTTKHMYLWTRGVSARSNIFNMNGGTTPSAISIKRRGIEPAPQDNRAYNNTCYTTQSASSATCVGGNGDTNTTAINNLIYAPNATYQTAAFANGTIRDNVVASSNPFASASPSAPSDFQLASSGPAVDGGGSIPWLGVDFAGGQRPTDGDGNGSVQWDAGAFEVGGGGGVIPPPPAPPAAPVLLP